MENNDKKKMDKKEKKCDKKKKSSDGCVNKHCLVVRISEKGRIREPENNNKTT